MEDHTFHEDFIAFLGAKLKPRTYLELGVGNNETLQKVRRVCQARMIAVDRAEPIRRIPLVRYFIKPVQEFLSKEAAGYAPFDLVFIDSDHRFEAVRLDFDAVWPMVSEQGLVLIHDTWPKDEEATGDGYCSDSWRFAVELRERGIESVTLPFHPGLTIVRKAGSHLSWEP